MATRAKFARIARYSRKFVEATHIFLENGLWQVSASLASPCNTALRVSASLASPCNTALRVSASLASPRNTARRMSSSLASPRNTARRMLSSLVSPRNTAWRMLASLGSHNINTKRAENTAASTRDIRKICTRKIRC
jgi:hypothetical protein